MWEKGEGGKGILPRFEKKSEHYHGQMGIFLLKGLTKNLLLLWKN